MPSRLDPAASLSIADAAATESTLTVMSVVALIFVPFVLAYQGWTYWVFRARLTRAAVAPQEERPATRRGAAGRTS